MRQRVEQALLESGRGEHRDLLRSSYQSVRRDPSAPLQRDLEHQRRRDLLLLRWYGAGAEQGEQVGGVKLLDFP